MKCEGGEVHVWQIQLDVPAPDLRTLASSLTPEERARADRFLTQQLRDRWIAARGALRHILAGDGASEPAALDILTGPQGKPYLGRHRQDVSFNLSHTGGIALVAVADGSRVGIDAEIVNKTILWEEVSRQFFAASETNDILSQPPEMRLPSFFACWTRKEAFIKALGYGLNAPLDQFRVTIKPDERPRLVSVDWDDAGTWSLEDLSGQNVIAALAVEGPQPVLRRFAFHTALGATATAASSP